MGVASFVAQLTADELRELSEHAVTRRFAARAVLFHQGEPPGLVLLIESGRVKVYATTEDGHEAVIGFWGPGELIGELAAFDGSPRSASVSAGQPGTALAIAPGDFARFVDSHPRITELILRVVIERMRRLERERVELGTCRVLARVARRLTDLVELWGEPDGNGIRISLPLTQAELASWAGGSREATSKALQTLRSLDAVETRRRHFTVLDLEALRRLRG